jgi:hypothetical protein
MAADDFAKALKRRRQISITVTGRLTGRAITMPVWFVSDDRALWLLPVHGSKTQWYRNLKKDRAIAAWPQRQPFRREPHQTPHRAPEERRRSLRAFTAAIKARPLLRNDGWAERHFAIYPDRSFARYLGYRECVRQAGNTSLRRPPRKRRADQLFPHSGQPLLGIIQRGRHCAGARTSWNFAGLHSLRGIHQRSHFATKFRREAR